jgi:predicted nucleic acid-binding protein
VTLYAEESGREDLAKQESIVVAQLTRVEVPAAFWRKHRMGEIDASVAQTLTQAFEADYYGAGDDEPPQLVALATTVAVLDRAAGLCATHGLRAYDRVQLASAHAVREADSGCESFAAYDDNLRRAAAAEGFRLVPPS